MCKGLLPHSINSPSHEASVFDINPCPHSSLCCSSSSFLSRPPVVSYCVAYLPKWKLFADRMFYSSRSSDCPGMRVAAFNYFHSSDGWVWFCGRGENKPFTCWCLSYDTENVPRSTHLLESQSYSTCHDHLGPSSTYIHHIHPASQWESGSVRLQQLF